MSVSAALGCSWGSGQVHFASLHLASPAQAHQAQPPLNLKLFDCLSVCNSWLIYYELGK